MSLRRADPARGSRRYDRGMPVTQGDGRPHWDGRWDGRPDRFRPPPAVTLLAPVIISLLVQVPAAIGIAVWLRVGWAAGLAQVALAAIGPLALLASRRYPGPTVAVVSAAALADLLLTPDVGPPYVALAFAIVLGIVRGAMLWTVLSVVVGWVAAIVLGAVVGLDWHPFRIALTTALLAACFGIGAFVRVRRERAAEFRAEAMRRRQTAEQRERVRIARELHDVIGHALSQINVQASVGLHLMDRDPEQARSALAAVKETSRTALEEVRSVLGVIRNEGDAPLAPQAELAELPRLVAGVRSPGFDAELVDRLDGAVPGRAAQFAALPHRAGGAHQRRAARGRDDGGGRRRAPRRRAPRHRRRRRRGRAGLTRGQRHPRHARAGGAPRRVRGGRRLAARRHARDGAAPVGSDAVIRVALADDQLLVRAGFRALLQAEDDIEVVGEASSGEELLALVRRDPVDVVLMDIRMPGGDGLWATEQIAADPALEGVHVVIVTTFELDEYVARAIRAGASGFLVKDTEPVDLIRAVRVVASGEALLSPGVTKRLLERMAVGLRDAPDAERLAALTDREREVLQLVGQGLTNDEIAERLVLSPLTAKTHVSRIMAKLHARDRVHLVVVAYESGLVAPGWQQ